MNKFKKILLGTLSVLTLGLFVAVGTKANAASYDYGTYRVTTSTNTNDTATWDYTGCTTGKTFSVGDTTNGLVVEATTFKTHASGYLSITGGKWLIPVPAGSSGNVKVDDSNPKKEDRYYNLLNSSSEVSIESTIKNTVENGVSFTADNIVTVNSSSYLRFQAAGGELKCKKIIITLSSGAFESTSEIYNVNYYDGTTLYHTEEVEENDTAKYYPYKMGYDCPKLYTDSSLETEFNSETPITGDLDLYCNFIAWDSSLIGDGNELSLDLIAKFAYGYTINASNTVALKDTIYSLLPSTGFEATNKTVGTFGNSTYAVKTSGTFSATNIKSGIAVTPDSTGTLSMYVYSSSNRTCIMYESTDLETEINSGQSTGSSAMTLVSYELEANKTYYFGGSGSLYIYYASFETTTELADGTTASVFAEKNATAGTIRFIGTITGINDLADIQSIELILTKDNVATKEQIFLTTCYTSVEGSTQECPEVDGTYYVIFRITGAASLTGTITKQLKVTYTDGSTTLSEVTNIVLS